MSLNRKVIVPIGSAGMRVPLIRLWMYWWTTINLRQSLFCRLAYSCLRMVEETLYVLFGLLGSECAQYCESVLHHLVVLQYRHEHIDSTWTFRIAQCQC